MSAVAGACSFRSAIRALLTAIGGISGPAHQVGLLSRVFRQTGITSGSRGDDSCHIEGRSSRRRHLPGKERIA